MEIVLKGIGLVIALYTTWRILILLLWNAKEGRINRLTFIFLTILEGSILMLTVDPNLIDSKIFKDLMNVYNLNPLIFNILFVFSSSNVMAKRFRDILGLGWIAVIILNTTLLFVPENLRGVFSIIILLYLFIAPSKEISS